MQPAHDSWAATVRLLEAARRWTLAADLCDLLEDGEAPERTRTLAARVRDECLTRLSEACRGRWPTPQ